MSTSLSKISRKPLADRLVSEALAIVVASGPDSLSVREVQRRAGVSPAAAYRHFKDRDALMLALAQEAAGRLAEHLAPVMLASPDDPTDLASARQRLLAGCRAYVEFAEQNPGLYRAIFVSGEQIDELTRPAERAQNAHGDGGYTLLVEAVGAVVAATGRGEADLWDPLVIWSACHGLAMLRLHAALHTLPADAFAAACERVFTTVVTAVPLEALDSGGWVGPRPD